MSEIKLFEGAEIVTRDGRNGVVTQHCDFLNYPWRIETYSIHPYYCDDNGNYLREWPEHTLDVVQILNPEDAPVFKENNGWFPFSEQPSGNARELLVTRDSGEGSIRTVKFMYWHPDKDKSLLFDAEFCEEFDPEDQEKTLNRFGFRILAWKEKPLPYGG